MHIEELFERHCPWWKDKIYWPIYRFLRWKVRSPRDWYYSTKYFIQRGRRGWSDRDTWSLDDHLAEILPPMLRHLKEHKHGIPMAMFEPEDTADDGYGHTPGAMERAEAQWDEILGKMIAAFEAWGRMSDCTYEAELGSYPLGRPPGVSRESWDKLSHDHFGKTELLRERDREIWEEGSALFIKHFGGLWD